MHDTYKFTSAEMFMALAGLLVCVVVGSKKENTSKKIKMDSRQTKLKATKVTFEDEVLESNERGAPPLPDQRPENHIGGDEDQSEDSASDSGSESSDQSEDSHQEEERPTTVAGSVALTPAMAERMLSYLDLMNLRTLRCECNAAHLMRTYIDGAQKRLDGAMRLLDEIPATMSHTERKVYLLEISQYVESIFGSLERQAVKIVKCHGDAMCDIIQEFDQSVKNIESEVPKSSSKPFTKRVDREKALTVLEIGCLFAFLVLSVFVGFLLTRPDIGNALGGFVVGVLNNTWNITDKNLQPVSESNSSVMDILG